LAISKIYTINPKFQILANSLCFSSLDNVTKSGNLRLFKILDEWRYRFGDLEDRRAHHLQKQQGLKLEFQEYAAGNNAGNVVEQGPLKIGIAVHLGILIQQIFDRNEQLKFGL